MLLLKKPKENPLWPKTLDQSVSFFGLKTKPSHTHTFVGRRYVLACGCLPVGWLWVHLNKQLWTINNIRHALTFATTVIEVQPPALFLSLYPLFTLSASLFSLFLAAAAWFLCTHQFSNCDALFPIFSLTNKTTTIAHNTHTLC